MLWLRPSRSLSEIADLDDFHNRGMLFLHLNIAGTQGCSGRTGIGISIIGSSESERASAP